ncbi:MAG: aldo/keto reductase [Actinobacteria bacterium]|nr:aldo/keto reductase [Actinomycetota bacterium]
MRYKILGKTGLEVSELAFGAIQLTRIEEKAAIDLVRMAHSEGINLIDTAHNYFNSEEILGKALKNIRKDMHIITKSSKRNKKEFLSDLNTSLKKLKTDYIDVYLFHSVSNADEIEEVVNSGLPDALVNEKKKGKIRHIGFSCHSSKIAHRFFEIPDFSVLMIPLNFITTEYVEKKLYDRFIKNNIGLLAMKPFGGGRLSDIDLCFKFLRLYPEVITVAGMQSVQELKQNIELVNKDDIPDKKDYKKIKKITEELGTRFCRQCGYCMPCEEKGIDIINVNFIEVYYKQFPMDEFWKLGLEQKVETARECIECGKCSEKCPFELDVPQIIKHNIAFFESLKKPGK